MASVTLSAMLSATLLLAVGARALIKVGDTLPADVTLDHGFPPEKVNVLERAKGKNIILYAAAASNPPRRAARRPAAHTLRCTPSHAALHADRMGLPGAFTPT